MKVVLAHDSFTQLGGAERVVLELARMYPDAPIYVLVADPKILDQLPEHVRWFFTPSNSPLERGRRRVRIRTSSLQWLYRLYPKFQHLLPFIPVVLWMTRIPKCDVLLSSSSAFAKGFRKPKRPSLPLREAPQSYSSPREGRLGGVIENKNDSGEIVDASSPTATSLNPSSRGGEKESLFSQEKWQGPRGEYATHINYCHTPTRFLWSDTEYIEQEVPWVVRWPAKIFLHWFKQWDLRAASAVDVFLANSKETQARVKKYYNRDSEVVYPFVDVEFWSQDRDKRQETRDKYFLIAGRLHAHKHNELVVQACNELGLSLHVIGTGRDEQHLRSIAGPTITFLGRVSDEQLRKQFTEANAYVYPQLEDFGLMPVEAAACGTPTIGINEGGSRETIVPGVTGEWFTRGNLKELKSLLQNWDKSKYSVEELRKHAERFSKDRFTRQLSEIVNLNIKFPMKSLSTRFVKARNSLEK